MNQSRITEEREPQYPPERPAPQPSEAEHNGHHEEDEKGSSPEDGKPKGPPIYKRPAVIIGATIVFVVLIVGGVVLWFFVRQFVRTDDAYIDGHVTQISPQISARTIELRITDNQFVHQGDLLVRLDPTDFQVALEQAQSQVVAAQQRVSQAQAQVVTAGAQVLQAQAQQDAAQASLDKTDTDVKRLDKLGPLARSQEQLDDAHTAQATARAQLEQAKANISSANAGVKTTEAAVKTAEADVKTAQANEHQARVNLGYCDIVAPVDGRVAERTIEVGNYVTTGQALFVLVDPNVWVTANLKETQLDRVRPGQPVTIKVDAFPETKFRGQVDSVQPGSGARFSVLPAENATGNYVKVVQRVPVKILFDHGANTNNAPMLSPGMSVIPRIKIR